MASTHHLDSFSSLMETQFATKRSPLRHVFVSQAAQPPTSRPHPAALPQQKVTFARKRRNSGHHQIQSNRIGKRLKIVDWEPNFDEEHLFQPSEAIVTFAPFGAPDSEFIDPFSNATATLTSHNHRIFSSKILRENQEDFWNVREKDRILCVHHRLRKRAKFLRKVENAKERHTTQQNVENAQRKILRCMHKIVNGHNDLERWMLKMEYYAKRGADSKRRECSDCKKLRQCRPGYEYGDWNFGLLDDDDDDDDETVLDNPLDELD